MLELLRRSKAFAAVAVLSALSFVSCKEPISEPKSTVPEPTQVFIVTLTPKRDTLPVGLSHLFSARVVDGSGATQTVTVTWTSLQPTIATVSDGAVTAVSAGTAEIVARYGQAADTAKVVVLAESAHLQILPSAVSGSLGDTLMFKAQLVTETGATYDVQSVHWEASDSQAVAIVDNGEVELRGIGDVDLIATVGEMKAKASVSVFAATVGSIEINPPSPTIRAGATAKLSAKVHDDTGRPIASPTIVWSSSNDAVAIVAADGTVQGNLSGSAMITAAVGTKRGTATVKITAQPATSLSLQLRRDTIVPAFQSRVIAKPIDQGGNAVLGVAVQFQSSDPAVATVSPAGAVVGVAPGATTITAAAEGLTASANMVVQAAQVTSIDIGPAGALLAMGSSARIVAEVKDQVGQVLTSAPVSWTSLSPSTLTIAPTGVVTGVAQGYGYVEATSNGKSQRLGILVTPWPIASVQLAPATATVAVDQSVQVKATGFLSTGQPLDGTIFDWSIADSAIVTASPLGIVTGKAKGTTTLTATSNGHSASATITVSDPVPVPIAAATVSMNAPSLDAGQTTQAVATLFDAFGNVVTGRTINWASSLPDLATVTASGLVTAVSPGSVAIAASVDGVTSFATVTITTPPRVAVASMEVMAPTNPVPAGLHAQLAVLLADAKGKALTGRSISFTSSNTACATVSSVGLVRAIAPGTTTVTVESEGVKKTVTINVQAALPTPIPYALTVTLNASALQIGQSTQATAVVVDTLGNSIPGHAISWSSANEAVATVSSAGLVTAVGVGTVAISATGGGKVGTADVVVSADPPTVASVAVRIGANVLYVGDRVQASAEARDATGHVMAGINFTWSVSSTTVLSVSADGEVSAVAVGSAEVEATGNGVTGRYTVSVADVPPDDVPNGLTAQAELPQVYLDFPYVAPTGRTITVSAGGNLQAALNSAKRGDEVVLPAGATFTGNFTLPAKSGTVDDGWITIRTDQLSALPAEGTRVTPAVSNLMPKIVTSNSSPALATRLGASGYRIVGIEITVAPSYTSPQYGIVWLGDGSIAQNQLSDVATDLVLDRVYIHGQTTTDTRRCVSLNSARTQITDSYLSECHSNGTDSQAIQGHNGPGPYKIVNNTLIAATENIVFGGGDPWITGMIPRDIEIRRNYLYTPPAWKGVWLKKNLFELKAGQRILIEGNVLDGSWTDGQTGWAFMLKTENQSGGCTWCNTADITIRYNYIRNAGAGVAITGREGSSPHPVGALSARFSVMHNVMDNINVGVFTGDQRFFQVVGNAQDVEISNNTATSVGYISNFLVFDTYPSATRLVFNRNAISIAAYGMLANSRGEGSPALGAVAGGWQFNDNYLLGPARAVYPAGTMFVGGLSAVPSGIGADQTTLNSKIAGVIIP